jgi:hypothetical protein
MYGLTKKIHDDASNQRAAERAADTLDGAVRQINAIVMELTHLRSQLTSDDHEAAWSALTRFTSTAGYGGSISSKVTELVATCVSTQVRAEDALAMSMLTVCTGTWRGTENGTTLAFAFFDLEPQPELIFRAANRIEDQAADMAALPEAYRPLRRLIDEHEMSSMSVGDWFELRSDEGRCVGRWTCDPVGWTVTR